MNTPGRAGGNWGWRFAQAMLTPELASRLAELTEISGRHAKSKFVRPQFNCGETTQSSAHCQDILGIGSEGRMNTPGRAGGNWGWRFAQAMLTPELASRLAELTETSGRAPRGLNSFARSLTAGKLHNLRHTAISGRAPRGHSPDKQS